MPSQPGRAAHARPPESLHFNTADLYPHPQQLAAASGTEAPPMTAPQIQSLLHNASRISFTSPAQDAGSGRRPDYFLGADGKLTPNPKATPSRDGSVSIEVQSSNKSETDAKKLADQLQKATIKDLINYFKADHKPGTPIPQDWLDMLNKEPDLPPPVVPLEPAPVAPAPVDNPAPPPQPSQPVDTGSSGGSAGGSPTGVSYGGDAGGSAGSSGGGNYGGDAGGASGGSPAANGISDWPSVPPPSGNDAPSGPEAARLAQEALKVGGAEGTVGLCLKGVEDTLDAAGLGIGRQDYAYQAADVLAKDHRFQEISFADRKPGDIVVYGPASWNGGDGHIAIEEPGGKEASDHIQNQVQPDGAAVRVFRPVG